MKRNLLAAALFCAMTVPAMVAQDAVVEGKVKNRKERRQARIAQGVKSGSLTPGQAEGLAHKEAKINREVARDRAVNGGPLTARQKAKINRQQNKVSEQIYDKKH